MRRLTKYAIIAAAALLAIASCKKKNEDESKETLPTNPKFSVPEYALVHDEILFESGGVTHPAGGELEWTAKAVGEDTTITLYEVEGKFRFVVLDTLCTYSITLQAADPKGEYYSVSTTKYVTAIRGGINVPGTEPLDRSISGRASDGYDDAEAVVEIDGEAYFQKKIGDNVWLCENLGTSGSGASYKGYSVMDNVFGRYYSWEEARTACPEGWRLPSETDWENMATALGAEKSGNDYIDINGQLLANDVRYNDIQMWEWWPRGDETPSGFDALPTGYANLASKIWNGENIYAVFWTADEENGLGIYRYMTADGRNLMRGTQDKLNFGASVRCIR